MTLIFNRIRAAVIVHVDAKYHQAKCSGSSVVVYITFFALSSNGKESEIPVPWPCLLTNDLVMLYVLSGCQDTCQCKMSSNWVQRFVSYHANSEIEKNDENNTVCRYRADGNKWIVSSPVCWLDGSTKHDIETSSEWSQLWMPQPACRHCVKSVSLPTQLTLLSQIWPLPGPYASPICRPLCLIEHIRSHKSKSFPLIGKRFIHLLTSVVHSLQCSLTVFRTSSIASISADSTTAYTLHADWV